jgi:hypothetical protein
MLNDCKSAEQKGDKTQTQAVFVHQRATGSAIEAHLPIAPFPRFKEE